MTAVLVTGGTGDLGSALVDRLVKADHGVRIMSRGAGPASGGLVTEWAQATLETGDGLAEAVDGIECVAHCASSPFRKTKEADVAGTRRLLDASKAAGVSHFLYISIVGIDKVPNPYYKHKLAAEKIIEDAGVPYTILRATQFHALLDRMFADGLLRFPIGAVPGSFKFQTIDTAEVAGRMLQLVEAGPSGRVADIGGPEVLDAGDMARSWIAATGRRRIVLLLPLFGKIASGFRQGLNCTPENTYGKITWTGWLADKYRSKPS
ncbi:MAG: NAD(P)H-binding protein [Chloroflexi bacterium]|nr:NAD(P)H-binding protein [Chloroflexota bacterium]